MVNWLTDLKSIALYGYFAVLAKIAFSHFGLKTVCLVEDPVE
jgi:hypothetical protein